MTLARYLIVFAGLALVGLIRLQAGSAAASADAYVKGASDALLDALYGPDGKVRADLTDERLHEAFTSVVNTDLMLRRSLSRHWNVLKPEERKQIGDLTVRLLIRTYAGQLRKSDRPAMSVAAARDLGAGRWEVPQSVTPSGGGAPVQVIYRVSREPSGWAVYDLVIEGVSVVSNYRQQFDAHFQKGDAAGLIRSLQARLDAPPAG